MKNERPVAFRTRAVCTACASTEHEVWVMMVHWIALHSIAVLDNRSG